MTLKEFFLLTGMTQRALCKKTGCYSSAMSNWTNEKCPVPVKHCKKIVDETYGLVTYQDLRPRDYMLYWPE
nr:MAG TPA: Putative antitoxin of bacterial toxin-antitoxin system, YdaS/YdaT [Caudoviricetes sp.]